MNEWSERDLRNIREWNESKHPRDGDGKFTSGNKLASAVKKYSDNPERDLKDMPSTKDKNKSQEELFGEEFKGVKGAAAIDKLLQEKRGHVKGAFYRDDIGDIDLLWGNGALGLQHIINQREKQGIDVKSFLQELPQVIEHGSFYQKSERGNFELLHNGKMAVIAPEYRGNKIMFVLTAYKTRKKAPPNDDA